MGSNHNNQSARSMPNNGSRTTYLLLVALLLPMATVVLTIYFFVRLDDMTATLQPSSAFAINVVALCGGLSAAMAVILEVTLFVIYRQRNRFERMHRKQNHFLNTVLDERMRMARSIDVLSAAHQVTMAIKQETSFERIAEVVLEQIEFFSRASDVVVYAAGKDNELTPRARRQRGTNCFGAEIDHASLELEHPYEALVTNRPHREYDQHTGLYIIVVPYATPDGVRGVVEVRRLVADDPDFARDMASFEAALAQLVKAVSVGLKFSAIWDRAIKDEMTGLYNKNHFNTEVPAALARALRDGSPLSLIMLDVDKFKTVNDTYGHLCGDIILRGVAGILSENLRDTDTAFRYGGEELCIVCRDTEARDASRFAERLRSLIAHTEFRSEDGQLVPVSASFGVAEFDPTRMQDGENLKAACDTALYHAKEHGRNQVVLNGDTGMAPLERTGDLSSEVKRRLGLGGDNLPLAIEPRKNERRRRAPAKPRPRRSKGSRSTGNAQTSAPEPTSTAPASAPSSAKSAVEKVAKSSGKTPRSSRKGTRKKPASSPEDEKKTETRGSAALAKPKSLASQKSVKISATLKAVEAQQAAQVHASDDSDRLDYITDGEAQALLDGIPPQKRARKKTTGESNTPTDWTPHKHW